MAEHLPLSVVIIGIAIIMVVMIDIHRKDKRIEKEDKGE